MVMTVPTTQSLRSMKSSTISSNPRRTNRNLLSSPNPKSKRLFEECGVEDEKLQNFDEQYELAAGEKSALVASNITNTRKFEIKIPDVVIHVAPDRAELVETRIIDGRKCLVIPMESEIELNGIRVSTLNSVEDTSAEPLPVNDITDIDDSNTEEEIPF